MMTKKIWPWSLCLFIILFDQSSKIIILKTFVAYEPKAILSFFNLTLSYNTGAAFSFLSHTGPWHHWFFLAFGIAMCFAIVGWMVRLPETARLQLAALSLVLGGAIGNLIDRVRLGHVVDFIQIYYKTFYWPVFNLADSAICVGAGLLMLDAILHSSMRVQCKQ